ncbi:MAG: Chemotaxis protein CheA [Firmicutes bacterium ADurb.Bin419]|nr:MAG: Chemotaxis protein CheA [Firmicutes bacterium ADurb.Bin419]
MLYLILEVSKLCRNNSSNSNKLNISGFFIFVLVNSFFYALIAIYVRNQIHVIGAFFVFCIINYIQYFYTKKRFKEMDDSYKLEITKKEQQIAHQKEEYDLQNQQINVYLEEMAMFADEKNKFVMEIENSQKELQKKEKSIRALLNNSAQGFLAFESNLLISEEYSSECVRIFGQDIAKRFFPSLLYPNNEEEQKLMVSILKDIFNEKEGLRRDVFISLLPKEAVINKKSIKIDYKIISIKDVNSVIGTVNEMVMVILTDITESRKLEGLMESEKNTLRMIVKVLTSRADFMDCLNDYYTFSNSIKAQQVATSEVLIDDEIYSFYMEIHKFKGVFSQLSLIHTPQKLHDIETKVSNIINNEDKHKQFAQFIEATDLNGLLDEDVDILKKFLGQCFFNNDETLLIDRKSIKKIEHKILTTLKPDECKLLLPELRLLRYIKAKKLVQKYADYIEKISFDYEKKINPLTVEGGEFLIDPEKYHAFSQSLVQIFRNAIAHGIESSDERIMAGKDEYATISCKITLNDNMMEFTISDDGRGIETDKVIRSAIEKGIIDNNEKLSENDIVALIFNDDFSTSPSVTKLSGRGVGLSSLKKDVNALGGYIEVNTTKGIGTTFNIALPYEGIDHAADVSLSDR